ncbi:hypothetical protein Q4519_20635 [Motilimonas sp. 1_MG-2023]|uniref:Uncharacterized protein n=1 Tax=Motilimonas cestriensis TaxID=2742685 RepID=A0ABS8W8J5_9GAMM|nr:MULTISPECIES: hypothetical protein [Motilimonas]MCE2594432.1 hypothetical protein [Motilimonas cestriensis]MDO6528085.1 hypothetical protein [Motilimonas sp. 1_MG-2023]
MALITVEITCTDEGVVNWVSHIEHDRKNVADAIALAFYEQLEKNIILANKDVCNQKRLAQQ